MNTPPVPTLGNDDAPEIGLRERKKHRTRMDTHVAALELVADHGLGGVTVEMIAERAGVSARTFFNYWPTKEAAILGVRTEDDQRLMQLLRARPADEDARTALRAALTEIVKTVPGDPALRALKKTVMARNPHLHGMSIGAMHSTQAALVEALTERIDAPDAHDRAVVLVQIGFAAVRSAFSLSMANGTAIVPEYERVIGMIDEGVVRI